MKIKKVLVTGGAGFLGSVLVKNLVRKGYKVTVIDKNFHRKVSNVRYLKGSIKNKKFIINALKNIDYVYHYASLAGIADCNQNPSMAVDTNIIGTSNIVNLCNKYKLKLIYFSTNYVYPSKSGNYKEHHPLLPFNNYAWSKLGGECAVQMYKNSLILRICMTEKPFLYKYAYTKLKTKFMFHEDLAKVFFKLINKKDYNKILKHITYNKLPLTIKDYFSYKDLIKILKFMSVDKKNISKNINLILLKKIGSTLIDKEYNIPKIRKFLGFIYIYI